jgi:PncC family amidohydrolase
MSLVENVQKRFIEKGWTLSLAESCTGGSLAAALTQIPGSSEYFLGSIVAYSNSLKTKLLHVPPDLIQTPGAVSREVALAMLEGILTVTGSDFALAVTGIAGPGGGSPTKPVGLVWGAIGNREGRRHAWSWNEPGDRSHIISSSVDHLLNQLLKF